MLIIFYICLPSCDNQRGCFHTVPDDGSNASSQYGTISAAEQVKEGKFAGLNLVFAHTTHCIRVQVLCQIQHPCSSKHPLRGHIRRKATIKRPVTYI